MLPLKGNFTLGGGSNGDLGEFRRVEDERGKKGGGDYGRCEKVAALSCC